MIPTNQWSVAESATPSSFCTREIKPSNFIQSILRSDWFFHPINNRLGLILSKLNVFNLHGKSMCRRIDKSSDGFQHDALIDLSSNQLTMMPTNQTSNRFIQSIRQFDNPIQLEILLLMGTSAPHLSLSNWSQSIHSIDSVLSISLSDWMSTLSLRQQQTILDRYQTVTPHLIDSIQRSHHNDDSNRRGFHLLLSSDRFLLIDPSINFVWSYH